MSDPKNDKRPSGGQGRFQSLETTREKHDEIEETTPSGSIENALREPIAEEEHEALGHLAESMVELREQEAEEPSLTQWREAMKTIYSEASRSDLTLEEKKQKLHDIYLARGKSRWPWMIAAAVAVGVTAAIFYTLLG